MSRSGFWVVLFVLFATCTVVTLSDKLDDIMQRIQTEPVVVDTVKIGLDMALDHCQHNFKWERWNCPREDFERETFNQNPTQSNRETAYIHAIIAAGTVYSITKKCSTGEFAYCNCDRRKLESPFYPAMPEVSHKLDRKQPRQWSWGGCSDDITFGTKIASEILEELQKNFTVHSFVHKHNYEVGEKIVKETMMKKCRCHGTSGSCSLQTCWMQTAPFKDISKQLYEKYEKALKLNFDEVYSFVALSNSIQLDEEIEESLPPPNSLIYLDESPDYCLPNATRNWPGTIGRHCLKYKKNGTTIEEKKSCRHLCGNCGHKVRTKKKTIKVMCNCKFQWCCTVNCDYCTETKEELYCR